MRKDKIFSILSFAERQLKTAFFVFLLFGFYTPPLALCSLLVLWIHEAGHLTVLFLLGKKTGFFRHRLDGFLLDCPTLSYKEEAIVAFFGPFFNFLSALLALAFLPLAPSSVENFVLLSLLTGIFNLLPIEGYDGGRITAVFLSSFLSAPKAFAVCRCLSFSLSIFFLFFSLLILLEKGQGYFLFGVFFAYLLSLIKNSRICEKTRI